MTWPGQGGRGGWGVGLGCVDLIMSCAGVCLTVKSGPYIHWSLPAKICETQTIPEPSRTTFSHLIVLRPEKPDLDCNDSIH